MVSQAPHLITARNDQIGSRPSSALLRPNSGSTPSAMAAWRRVSSSATSTTDLRATSVILTPLSSLPPATEVMKKTSAVLRSNSRPSATRTRNSGTSVSPWATARPMRWVIVTLVPLTSRTWPR